MDLNLIVFLLGTLVGSNLIVLKYAPLKTKLLFVIFSCVTFGNLIMQDYFTLGGLIMMIGILIAAPFATKGIKDLIPEF